MQRRGKRMPVINVEKGEETGQGKRVNTLNENTFCFLFTTG